MEISSTERQLETFRKAYRSIRVMVYDDCMVYNTAHGFARKAAQEANKLIAFLGLPLTATATAYYTNDTFKVELKTA